MSIAVDNGEDRILFDNGSVALEVTTGFGPRIAACRLNGAGNIMAELPNAELVWQPGRPFRLYGGHRLWVAPEVRQLTYTPDDDPVLVTGTAESMCFTTPAAESSPLRRSMTIQLHPTKAQLEIRHELELVKGPPRTVACWAITMLQRDGIAVLPLGGGNGGGLQADRNIVMWPYTRLDDPLIHISDRHIRFAGARRNPAKIGTGGAAGWAGYATGDTILIKRVSVESGASYADLGASLQCYANAEFCELETLGPLRTLQPGESISHLERWEMHRTEADLDDPEEALAAVAGAA